MLYCSDRKYDTPHQYSGSLVTVMPSRTYPVSLPDFIEVNMITQQRLKEVLHYDPDRGVFTRRIAMGRNGCHPAGQAAGTPSGHGYVKIGIDKTIYYAHRLAWLYIYGEFSKQIDHINGNPSDNRICNLRLSTQSQNLANTKPRKSNYGRGIYKNNDKYSVRIYANKVLYRIGTFSTIEEAQEAYAEASKKYHGEYRKQEAK